MKSLLHDLFYGIFFVTTKFYLHPVITLSGFNTVSSVGFKTAPSLNGCGVRQLMGTNAIAISQYYETIDFLSWSIG